MQYNKSETCKFEMEFHYYNIGTKNTFFLLKNLQNYTFCLINKRGYEQIHPNIFLMLQIVTSLHPKKHQEMIQVHV